jgi:hypothetical protein
MQKYKLFIFGLGQTTPNVVCLISKEMFIPFDPANTDYQQFKKDVLAGAELQDADGNVMTQEEVSTFVETLP